MFDWVHQSFMVQALVGCGAMGVLLAYLGIHVVGRGIVFVDLALGQISSMGVAYAMYSGRDPVLCSMVGTLIGAGVFTVLRVRDERLRLEAIIGIFYAASAAVTVLLIAKTPHGDADIQDVIFGNVLAMDPTELRHMLYVFGAVALFHAALGRRFFALTYAKRHHHHDLSFQEHAMNLLFYVSLAFAIVFAIRAGGVIPVFSYLIVPPVAAILLARPKRIVIPLALAIALCSTFFGLHLSFTYDFPAGASIVAALGAAVLTAAAIGVPVAAVRRSRAKKEMAAATTATAALVLLALAPSSARAASGAGDVGDLRQQIKELKAEQVELAARLQAIETKLGELEQAPPPAPPPPPPPPAPHSAAGGLKLIDISLDGLFAAAGSTAPEPELRKLEGGGHDPKNLGITLQNLELTLQGAVDPFLRGDANIVMQIDPEGESTLEVEEAYLTTLALPGSLQVQAGTKFAPFGRLNPMHPHAWDFADQPVIATRMFGGDGLRGPCGHLSWLLPTPFQAEAVFGVQDSQGETATSFRGVPGETFAGRTLTDRSVHAPSDLLYLGRFSTSFDPTSSFTIVPGVSYVTGPNATGPSARTSIGGLDLYAKWKPLANDHGWPFVAIQMEAMDRRYEAAVQIDESDDLIPAETLRDRGGYLQGLWGFKRRWVAGLRYDRADGSGDNALDPVRDFRERLSTDLTFFPSEFSKFRLQLNRDRADHLLGRDQTSVFFQFEYLYGAHGAHKF